MLISYKLIINTLIFIFLFQGCGNNTSTKNNYPTTLGDSTSVTTNDNDAVMAPSAPTLKNIGIEIGEMVIHNISTHNQQEATQFGKQIHYCDISGEKESEQQGVAQGISNRTNYKRCEELNTLQKGEVQLEYRDVDSEGKYPKKLMLTIIEDYSYNEVELKKGLHLNSDITYDNKKKIKSISININGAVLYEYGNYTLRDSQQILNY